jgi:hypothetical protein
VGAGSRQVSTIAALRGDDKNKRLFATAVRPGAGTSRVPVTAARGVETQVAEMPGQATEVRIAEAVVVETGLAIAALPVAEDLVAPAPLAAALAGSVEAAPGPAVPEAHPAWEAGAVVVAGVGGRAHEAGGGNNENEAV